MKFKPLWALIFVLPFGFGCANNNKSDAYGNFEATEIVISAEANGKLMRFIVDEGKHLEKGAIVGFVDTLQLHLNYRQMRARRSAIASQIQNVRSEIAVLEEQKHIAQKEVVRFTLLVEDNAVAKKKLDDMQDQVRVITKQINATQTRNANIMAEVQAMDAQLKLIRDQLEKSVIRNPISGIVLTKYSEENEVVSYGKPLYKIADLDTLYLRVYISGAQLPGVKLGQSVEVLIDKNDTENETLTGAISWISDKAEFTPKTIQTKEERVAMVYAVKIRVKNDGRIKIGMPGEINFM